MKQRQPCQQIQQIQQSKQAELSRVHVCAGESKESLIATTVPTLPEGEGGLAWRDERWVSPVDIYADSMVDD
jgi:hypothetical protein